MSDYKHRGIYAIYSMELMKAYLGHSENINSRLSAHRYKLRFGGLTEMKRDWRVVDDFKFTTVERYPNGSLPLRLEHWKKEFLKKGFVLYNDFQPEFKRAHAFIEELLCREIISPEDLIALLKNELKLK